MFDWFIYHVSYRFKVGGIDSIGGICCSQSVINIMIKNPQYVSGILDFKAIGANESDLRGEIKTTEYLYIDGKYSIPPHLRTNGR